MQGNFLPILSNGNTLAVSCSHRRMPKDVARVPKFGAFVKRRRGDRSLQAIANQMNAIGVERAQSSLFRYEEGRIPSVDVLRGLSFALRVPFEDLVDMVLDELGIAAVPWGHPVLHGESELDEDVLVVARAYAASNEEHVKAATRALLRIDAPAAAAAESGVTEVTPREKRFLKKASGGRRRPLPR